MYLCILYFVLCIGVMMLCSPHSLSFVLSSPYFVPLSLLSSLCCPSLFVILSISTLCSCFLLIPSISLFFLCSVCVHFSLHPNSASRYLYSFLRPLTNSLPFHSILLSLHSFLFTVVSHLFLSSSLPPIFSSPYLNVFAYHHTSISSSVVLLDIWYVERFLRYIGRFYTCNSFHFLSFHFIHCMIWMMALVVKC